MPLPRPPDGVTGDRAERAHAPRGGRTPAGSGVDPAGSGGRSEHVPTPAVRVAHPADVDQAGPRTRYRQSLLGGSWGILQPITLLAIYGWTITAVLDVVPSDVPYLVFAWSGVVPFAFVSQALSSGVGSLQMAGPLISRVYFPREVLPLSAVSATFIDLLIMLVILVVAAWIQVGPPTVTLLGLIPVYLMLIAWAAALSLLAGTITVFRRDLNHAVPLLLRALFILSPVVYSADLLQRPCVLALPRSTPSRSPSRARGTRRYATRGRTHRCWGPTFWRGSPVSQPATGCSAGPSRPWVTTYDGFGVRVGAESCDRSARPGSVQDLPQPRS